MMRRVQIVLLAAVIGFAPLMATTAMAQTNGDPDSFAPSTPGQMLGNAGTNAKAPGTAQGTPTEGNKDLFEEVTGIDTDETPLVQIGFVAAINTFFDWFSSFFSSILGGIDLTPGYRLGA